MNGGTDERREGGRERERKREISGYRCLSHATKSSTKEERAVINSMSCSTLPGHGLAAVDQELLPVRLDQILLLRVHQFAHIWKELKEEVRVEPYHIADDMHRRDL